MEPKIEITTQVKHGKCKKLPFELLGVPIYMFVPGKKTNNSSSKIRQQFIYK
jgi:hypothetical protein